MREQSQKARSIGWAEPRVWRAAAIGLALVGVIALLGACASGPRTTELKGVEVSTFDEGARWLSQGIDEVSATSGISEEQEVVFVGYLSDLMADPALRADRDAHDVFLSTLESDGYPGQAIEAAEAAIVRASSPLNYHEGFWVTVVESPDIPRPIEAVSDIHIDAWTGRVTVYAQTRSGRRILAPVQVGPGEFVERPDGQVVGFHPNAVYLNGTGNVYNEDVGGGSWWVKHSWILGGEGYNNWQLSATDYSSGGQYVEGRLLEDGITMEMSAGLSEEDLVRFGFSAEEVEGQFYGNLRRPNVENEPATYDVIRYEPANLDPEAGPIDATSTETFVLTSEFTTRPSPLDGLSRELPDLGP